MTDARVTDLFEQLRTALADRYAIERKIGEGGMATVYFARDLAEPRDVAIKVLRPELAASIGGDRFVREIEVASKLNHPNILGLYDSGQTDDFLWFTMPYIVGESLRDRLEREGQLPLDDALSIIRQVGNALAFAHKQGIIHRDIKPENILLTGDRAIVADFGIARAVTQAGGEKLTRTGMAVGTPVYMSPEQAMADKVDARSDEYSVGCVLYEMLVGQPPFTGSNPVALMARHSMEKVPSVRLVRETVPDQVENVIMKALAKAPADRYQTMDQFVTALEGAETAPIYDRKQRGKAASRKRLLVGAAIGAVVVLAGAGAFLKFRSKGAVAAGPPPSQLAILYFEDKSPGKDQAFLADGLTETLIHELSQVKVLQVISRNGVAPYRKATVSDDSISRALKVGTIVRGSVVGIGDSVRVEVALENPAGEEVGSTQMTRARTDLFALQDDLAKEVSIFLRKRVGQEVELQESRAGTRNVKAWELEQQAQTMAAGIDSLAAAGDPDGAARETRRVDSMFARVEQMDGKWVSPIVQRAWLDYRQARRASDKSGYAAWIDPGLAHAERAIALQPNDADALEVRGTLRYLKWLVNIATDQTEAARLLAGAEQDLRASVEANTAQASAWATLSHLLNAKSRTAEGKVAATRAYAADPYLTNASTVVWRLFQNSLDLDDRPEATRWCAEGQRRFPENPRFIECQIWIYALKGEKPDIPRAWALLNQYAERYPPNLRPYWTKRGSMLVAMALARANLPDSAKAVATRARLDANDDPTRELSFFEAIVRVMVGDNDEAIRLLNTYYAANPQLREGLDHDETWWFKPLKDDPRYKSLIAS
ncbi:MAG: protein kinase domain-containing protein [Bacillota bacterium]